MKASRKGLSPLVVLRIDGPLDSTTLAEMIDEPWVVVVRNCHQLEDFGYAAWSGGRWDVTAEGRLYADARLAVRRDEQRERVGVSQL